MSGFQPYPISGRDSIAVLKMVDNTGNKKELEMLENRTALSPNSIRCLKPRSSHAVARKTVWEGLGSRLSIRHTVTLSYGDIFIVNTRLEGTIN